MKKFSVHPVSERGDVQAAEVGQDSGVPSLDLPDQPDDQIPTQTEPQAPLDLPDQDSALLKVHDDVKHLDPDHAASVMNLSNQLGAPVQVVDKDLNQAKIASIAPDDNLFDQVEKNYPGTKQFLIDPKNMAVARDDIPNLTGHESLIGGITRARTLSEDFMAGEQGSAFGLKSRMKMPDLVLPEDAGFLDRAAAGLGGFAGDYQLMLAGGAAGGMAGGAAGAATLGGLAGVASGGALAIPGAAVGGLIGGFLGAGYGTFAAPAAAKEYLKQRIQKGDIQGAKDLFDRAGETLRAANKQGLVGTAVSAVGGTIAAPFEMEAAKKMLPWLFDAEGEGLSLLGKTAKTTTGIGAESVAMTAAEDKAEGKDFDIKDVGDNAFFLSLLHGSNHLVNTSIDNYVKGRDAETAKQFTLALGDSAVASKLRKRMPEAYRNFVDQVAKDGPVENINIPVDKFKEYFQSKNLDPAAIVEDLGVTDSYNEASQTGGDVSIPLGTWAEKIAPTEHAKGLSDDVKYHPDDLTMREVLARQEKTKQDLTDLEANSTQSPFAESAQSVAQDVEKQLVKAGRSEQEAKDQAETYRRFFGKMAAETGQDPLEIYNQYGLQIKGPEGAGDTGVPPWPGDEPKTFEQKAIDHEKAIKDIFSAPDAVEKYKALPESNGGQNIDPDIARHLYEPYNQGREGAILHTERMNQAAGELAKRVYEDRLKAAPESHVHILAGGSASGKTRYRDTYNEELKGTQILVDTSSKSFDSSKERIDKALNSGRKVLMTYIYRDFDQALAGNAERFKRDGRVVPPAFMADSHVNALNTFLKLADEYKGDKDRVTFEAFDNSGPEIEPISLAKLDKMRYNESAQGGETALERLTKLAEERLKNETEEIRATKERASRQDPGISGGRRQEDGGVETSAPQGGSPGQGELDPKKTYFQAAPTPALSPLGFYSALGHEIQKMDFKEIPAKDLAGRISNLSGVKKEELEYTGILDWLKLQDGKVSKEQVTEFLNNEGVKVEQVVLSKDFKGSENEDVARETDWQEPQRDHSSDDEDYDNELEYYSSDYWNDEKKADLRNELAPDYTNDDGSIDENALDQAMDKAMEERSEKLAQESVDSDDYPSARYSVTDDATGWKLYGSDELGWYSPELDEHLTGDLEEVKVKLLQHMIATGDIEGNVADHIKPKDIEWREGTAVVKPTKAAVTRRTNALLKKDGARFKAQAVEDNSFYLDKDGKPIKGYTQADYDKEIKRDSERLAREEIESTYDDPSNPKNQVSFSIKHDLIHGNIIGNDHKGYTFELEGKKEKVRGGGTIHAGGAEFPLEAKTIDEAKAEAIKVLIDQKKITEDKPKELAEGEDAPDVNEPTGRTRYGQYTEPGGKNYREILLTLPPEEGQDTFKSGHFDQKNILAHVRLSDRVDAEGRKTLFIEEMQSDMHQQGREKGYKSEGGEVPDAPFKNTEAWAGLALKRMIRMAVEQGYDSVAWTPAETHVERWGTDNVSWVKKGDHWLVGSAEQRGGRADGMDIEALARARGKLLERNGEKVHSKEELKKVIADTLGRERDDRSLESLTESVWKQMQDGDSGAKNPRKEGMEFFYDNVLPKKVAPKILKALDPQAKVTVGEFDTGENDLNAKWEYSGPEVSASALLDMRGDPLNATFSRQAKDVADALDDGTPFKDAMEKWSSPDFAEALGGKLDSPKKILKSWEIPLTDALKEKVKLGQALFQGDENDARGRIRFGKNMTVIDLFKSANESTFAHESAHLFLEVVGQLSRVPDASEQLKKDYQTVLDYLGVKSPEEIQTAHHETFAKSWEAYLLEGKAPAEELQGAFSRMRNWLLSVYQNVKNLGVQITPEIKQVFDRMLATNKEIDDAKSSVAMTSDVQEALEPAEAKKIRALEEQARDVAVRSLMRPQIQEIKKERKEFLDKERTRLTETAKTELKDAPLTKAINDIGGRDIEKVAQSFLDGKAAPEQEAKFEATAELYGFEDGKDLASKILSDGSKDGQVALIKRRVDAGMKAHENLLDPEQIKIDALKAIHTDKMAELLATEAQALQDLTQKKEISKEVSKRKRAETKIDTEAAKAQAQEILNNKTLKDAGQFRTYVTAERNAALKVSRALRAKDFEAAAAAKREQMLAHQLVSEALKNREVISKNLKYLNDLSKRGRNLNDMPYGFARQLDQMLSNFGLVDQRPEDLKNLQLMAQKMADQNELPSDIANATGLRADRGQWRPEALVDFLDRINENYYGLHVPDSVLNGSHDSYRDMSFQELKDLRGSAQAIAEIGKTYDRWLSNDEKITMREAAKELRKSIEENAGKKYQERKAIGSSSSGKTQDAVRKIKDLLDSAIPSLVNILTLAHFLDGGEVNGPAKEYIYRPIKDAENRKLERYQTMTKDVENLLAEHYTPKELADYKRQRTYQEAFGRYLTREEALSLALNWGNEGNRDRIRRGYNVSDTQVLHVLNTTLDKNDFNFVQKTWDHLESYWPEIKALEMKINGVEPLKVERARLDTMHGSYEGGYYPISYDFEKSADAFQNAEQKNEVYRQYSVARAQTDSGHTQERVSTLSRPVRLSMDVLFNHLENIVHDLEFRSAIIDVNRFLNLPDTKQALENSIGIKGYRGIGDWLKSVGSDQSQHFSNSEKAFQWFRFSATLSQLAIKPVAIMLHTGGNIINAASEMGALRTGSVLSTAMMDAVRGEGNLNSFVSEKSEMMNQRHTIRDRDIMDMAKKWKGTAGTFASQYAFSLIHLADKTVSVPLWADTYKQNLSEFGHTNAKQIADETVVRTLGSGSPVDRVGAQRGSEFQKITTMFYSWMSVMFNRAWAEGKFAGLEFSKGNVGAGIGVIATATMYNWILPGAWEVLAREVAKNAMGQNADDQKKRITGELINVPFSYIPVVRDISAFFIHQALGERGEDHYKISPLESAVESVVMPAGKAVNLAFTSNKHADEKFAEQTARGLSTALGVPQQLDTWAFNLLDYSRTDGQGSYKDFLSRRTKH